jgi:hypothetical protein
LATSLRQLRPIPRLVSDIPQLLSTRPIFERKLLRHLIDGIPDAIYFKDVNRRYIRLNAAELSLLIGNIPFLILGADGHDRNGQRSRSLHRAWRSAPGFSALRGD